MMEGRVRAGDAVEIAIDMAGPSAAAAVFLFHGAGQTRHSWRGTASMLASAGYCATRADLRGHGESDWSPAGDYSLDALAGDVRAVLGASNRPAVVVGASVGGIASLLALGEARTAHVRGLVLVDVVPRLDFTGAQEIEAFMRSSPGGFASPDEAARSVAAYLPHRERPLNPSGLERNLRLKADGRYYWHWDPLFLDARVAEREERILRLEAAAANLDIPVLLIRGANSRVVTAEGVAALREVIPHASFFDVAGADHMVAGDSNDAFNAPLLAFVEGALGGAKRAEHLKLDGAG